MIQSIIIRLDCLHESIMFAAGLKLICALVSLIDTKAEVCMNKRLKFLSLSGKPLLMKPKNTIPTWNILNPLGTCFHASTCCLGIVRDT